MAHYKWQVSLNANGPIWAGVISGDTNEHSTDVLTGGAEATFGYLDSNVVSTPSPRGTNNTSEVDLIVETSWTVSFDNRNNMTIQITNVIPTIERTQVIGNPKGSDSSGRNIRIYNYEGGSQQFYYHDSNINQAKLIGQNITLPTYTITLAPGESTTGNTIYIFNKNDTYSWTKGDHLYAGIKFTNDMPPDYRPGAILKNGEWLSHNRNGGEAHILCNRWSEMRTDNGHSENDNPPSIRMDNNRWTDQLLIGKE